MSAARQLPPLTVRLMMNAGSFLNTLDQVNRSLARLGNDQAALAIGRALTARITLPLTIMGGAAVAEFAKFDKAMTESLSIMQNVTPQLREELESLARSMARETITSADDLAKSYYYLTQSGLDVAGAMASLDTVNRFAIAGMFDQKEATDILTDAQAALGKNISDNAKANAAEMTRIGDILVKASTIANSSVEQFSTALTSKAGAAMKLFNRETEEGVAVLAAYADQGVRAELAGNSYDRALRLLAKSAVANADAHKALGFSVFDAQTGAMRPMADILENLTQIMSGLNDEQKIATMLMLGFEARSQQAITPLLGMEGQIRRIQTELRMAGGAILDVSNIVQSGFTAQMTIFWNQVKDISIEIGEQLVPVLRILTGVLQTLMQMWQAMPSSMQATIVYFGLTAAAAGPLTMAIFGLRRAIALVGPALTMFATRLGVAQAAAVATRLSLVGLAALVGVVFVKSFYNGSEALKKFNDEMQRADDLATKWENMVQQRMNKQYDTIKGMKDEKAQTEALAKAQAQVGDAARTSAAKVRYLEGELRAYLEQRGVWGDAQNMMFGDTQVTSYEKEIEVAKRELATYENQQARLDALKKDLASGTKEIAPQMQSALEQMQNSGLIDEAKSMITGGDMMDAMEEFENNIGKASPAMKKITSQVDEIAKDAIKWHKNQMKAAEETRKANEASDKRVQNALKEQDRVTARLIEAERKRTKQLQDAENETRNKWQSQGAKGVLRNLFSASLPRVANFAMAEAQKQREAMKALNERSEFTRWRKKELAGTPEVKAKNAAFAEDELRRKSQKNAEQQLTTQEKMLGALNTIARATTTTGALVLPANIGGKK